ncbi:MAG: PIN domain nuclease [Cyanobacteria bacterium QS_8_48_54]|jgi:predicted nucleic acid-binding protein|nr:MAG: PIN domain nuclease [Cyanobacteria bacterium QH_2_48_84]PSO71438.1 MAG: PIN domain nuclease [Cyanobacteria bacterium QS_1_48_34]PSP35025.1 MAG: PIN domain nuclease [Cyanobacteria bacterium QS_8_48_54]
MSGSEVLLDSVILIDHLNEVSAATEYLRQTRNQSAISVITRAELLVGLDAPAREITSQLLDQFDTLEMTVPIADLAAVLRRQEGWKLPDAIQAAFARFHRLTLVTRNIRDFPPERYDFIFVPYQ